MSSFSGLAVELSDARGNRLHARDQHLRSHRGFSGAFSNGLSVAFSEGISLLRFLVCNSLPRDSSKFITVKIIMLYLS